jgi:alanine racemase
MAKFDCPSLSSHLVVDLDAVRSNFRAIAGQAAPAECGAVVKADAYGLGARRVAPALYSEGCRTFFVAQLCEALDLHASLALDSAIVIVNGVDPDGETTCAEHGFVPVLNSATQVERWRRLSRSSRRPLPAALQLDTGMSRLGLDVETIDDLTRDQSLLHDVALKIVMTHLACAEDRAAVVNARQLQRLKEAAVLFPGARSSISNSCGAALSPDFHLDLLRAGIALYGVPPENLCLGIAPVVSLSARVLQIRDVQAGTRVGYGLTYAAPGPRRLATLAIGYADGWPRSLSGVGAAWHRDVRLPIVGRISMDTLTVDISAAPADSIAEGDFVDLLGPRQALHDVAADAGTIPYEILTRLGRRHARTYVENGIATTLMPGTLL